MTVSILMMKRVINLLRDEEFGLPITFIYKETCLGNYHTIKELIKLMLHLNFIKYSLRKSQKFYYVNKKLLDIIDGRE